ncbi:MULTISPECIES: fused MFS/spermidine synthase [unclassified Bradyrhizobium]|uniref:spermidine synthase n=1 Tax=unclassified Bradyrhizobium TaxID=2631580 RepID=UPI0028EE4FE5|nr:MULTISPECIES: fused MFS/spermidine synthase [unclassified Bradyrhizobium]
MLIRSVIFGALASVLFTAASQAQDTRHLLESKESLYNNIYVYEQPPYRSMTFGHNRRIYTESVYNTQDEKDLPVDYTRFMTASLMYAKDVHSILEIGFGGGRTAWYLHRFLPDVPVTSVELDPTVLELAKKYFGIKEEPNFHVANRDGRLFLQESKDRYDVILIDAYRGPFVPFHLLTKEFYQLVKDHLADGGVVAQNIEPTTMLFDSAIKTINTVFPQLDFYRADGNIVTVAYLGDERKAEDLAALAQERDKAYGLRYRLQDMLAERRRIDVNGGDVIAADAKVLSDDFAPVENLKSIERHNRKLP